MSRWPTIRTRSLLAALRPTSAECRVCRSSTGAAIEKPINRPRKKHPYSALQLEKSAKTYVRVFALLGSQILFLGGGFLAAEQVFILYFPTHQDGAAMKMDEYVRSSGRQQHNGELLQVTPPNKAGQQQEFHRHQLGVDRALQGLDDGVVDRVSYSRRRWMLAFSRMRSNTR